MKKAVQREDYSRQRLTLREKLEGVAFRLRMTKIVSSYRRWEGGREGAKGKERIGLTITGIFLGQLSLVWALPITSSARQADSKFETTASP
jgi:hypothetical protein